MAVGDTYILDEKQGKSLNRIDTKANWEAVNPVLAIGEMGIEKDGLLQNIKIGDGVTPWNSLGYMFKSCPYDVGDILVTMNATDPAVRWPGTTWEVFAPGRVLIGAGTGTDVNGTSMTFAVGATGGEYSHQLTVGELASHNHNTRLYYGGYSGWPVQTIAKYVFKWSGELFYNTDSKPYTGNIASGYCISQENMGNNNKHSQVPTYLSASFYKRTS